MSRNFYKQNRVDPPPKKTGRPSKIDNSSDPNPIEHIWDAMGKKKYSSQKLMKLKQQQQKKKELLIIVNQICDSFPRESIDSLIMSFTGRCINIR